MPNPRFLLLPLVLAVLVSPAISPFAAEDSADVDEPTVTSLDVRVENEGLVASFRLAGLFDDEFRRRLASGLPTDVEYRWVLERDRRGWFDSDRAEGRLLVTALYNAVTEEYRVDFKRDGELVASQVVREPEALRVAMTERTVPIASLASLDPEERLRLRLRAELGTRTVFLFIPRTRATDWAETQRFRVRDLVRAGGARESADQP